MAVCAVAILGAFVGCGGDSESAGEGSPTLSRAAEPPEVFVKRLAKLLATTTRARDCAQLDEINRHSSTRFSCPPEKSLRSSMASFKVVGAEEYGTGAIVDYKSGELEGGGAIVLFVATDRQWGIARFGITTEPSTGTDDERSRARYDEAVERYLTAVRERSCETFKEVAFSSRVEGEDVCKTTFAKTKELAKRLKVNPTATPRYVGGNATYGFYNLETRKPEPENSTIGVIKSSDGTGTAYVVLDVLPSQTAAEHRRLVRQAQESPDTTPSSKPSDPAVKP
jgi:hypothetical protein